MKKIRFFCVLCLMLSSLAVLVMTNMARAQQYLRVQSSARPFGLDIVDQVQRRGTDDEGRAFRRNLLPAIDSWVANGMDEGREIGGMSVRVLDPAQIELATANDVQVFFTGEDAGFSNTLGFNTSGSGVTSGDPKLIFPNTSIAARRRTQETPLRAGDFVDLGTMAGGTNLDFFMIADGANGGDSVYSTESSENPDGMNYARVYALNDSPYLIVAFEDLYGQDPDYNDLYFVAKVGGGNVEALAHMPEPSTYIILSSFLGLAAYLVYRRRQYDPAEVA